MKDITPMADSGTRGCEVNVPPSSAPVRSTGIDVALLTGGFDRPYAFGLSMELTSRDICLDVIGSREVDSPEMRTTPRLSFLDLQADPRERVSSASKAFRILHFYVRLLRYAATAKPQIFHILWNNKIQIFDRTLLMLYYKLLGKKIVLTAHNVNSARRDSKDSALNRLTLRIQYQLADHIFVHTEQMKRELLNAFGVCAENVTVIPFGINNAVPNIDLTPAEAKRRLGIGEEEHTVLFFGAIRPYKGLEYLVEAFQQIASKRGGHRLIIAGEPKKGCEEYFDTVRQAVRTTSNVGQIIQKYEYVPDSETELYLKAADVMVLPYTQVFQSGVLFLAYSFGLPVLASDVGSFREDIVEGETGFVCKACDANELAKTLERYFESDLFRNLDSRRQKIRDYASRSNSWQVVGEATRDVYLRVLGKVDEEASHLEHDASAVLSTRYSPAEVDR
jgi:glycosyltransferase involved in cell wall biosynthesis